jgi:hypothetical protein
VIHLRNFLRLLLLLCVLFGIPALAAILAGQIGWNSRLVGWLTLLLLAIIAWLGFRAERKGGWLGAGLRNYRRVIFPNSERPRKVQGRSRKRD